MKIRDPMHLRHPVVENLLSNVPHCPLATAEESCHTYECVISLIQIRHVTHIKESWHTYECVMRLKSHGTQTLYMCDMTYLYEGDNESWHTYECVMCLIQMHCSQTGVWECRRCT